MAGSLNTYKSIKEGLCLLKKMTFLAALVFEPEVKKYPLMEEIPLIFSPQRPPWVL